MVNDVTQDAAKLLEARLAALRQDYCEKLPGRLAELQQYWAQWNEAREPEVLRTFHRATHSLTGNGATFGFEQLSARARDLERLLKPLAEESAAPDVMQSLSISAALDAVVSVDLVGPGQQQAASRTETLLTARGVTVPEAPMVYVADPNPLFLSELSAQLTHFGLQARSFGGLYDIQAAIEAGSPDLVLLNAQLPGIEEGEVYALTRALSREMVPVIMLSTQTDFSSRLEAARAGAVGFNAIPVDMAALIAQIDRFASQHPQEPFRILLVDDEPVLAAWHATVLEEAGMATLVLNDPAEVQAGIDAFSPDVIVTDLYMPGITGIEMAQVLRQQERYDSIPIVFLSSESDAGTQLAALGMGADDFQGKPIVPEHFVSSLRSRAARARALRATMMHDGLTGLLNRKMISGALDREFARARRFSAPLSVAMLDVDYFKKINDSHGHPAGDRVLRALARLLRQRVRQTDYVGRYGGEEFMLVLPETGATAAGQVIDKLREVFGQLSHTADSGGFKATFSAGVAEAKSCQSADALVRAADAALYQAKQEGRNRVVTAQP